MSELAKALAAFQAELPPVIKENAAIVEGVSKKTGKPFVMGYKYADLASVSEVVLPLLGKHGLAFMARPTLANAHEGRLVLLYSLLHESGEEESGAYPLPQNGTPQQIGSAITYARRYCLCAVTGVAAAEDDDGAEAEKTGPNGLVMNKDGSVSRTKNSDEQLAASGNMTRAQKKAADDLRADGEPAPGRVQILAAVPDDDPWQLPAEERPNTATADQIRDLNIWIEGLGYRDRAAKLRLLGEGIGRVIKSSKDLSFNEAAALLKERDLPPAEGGDAQ